MTRLLALSADTMLDDFWPPATVFYLALFTSDPGSSTNAPSGEYTTGSGPARQPITFGSAAAGAKVSSGTDAAQTFTSVPAAAGGVLYFGICSAATGANYMCGGLTSGLSGSIPSGASIVFAAGAVSLGLS
jgi:hypothetical protein